MKFKIKSRKSNKRNAKCLQFFWLKRKNYWYFRDYSFVLSEAKYKAKYENGLKIINPIKMLQKFSIAFAQ